MDKILCILGSRLDDAPQHIYTEVEEHIYAILAVYSPSDWYVISGGARGVDSMVQSIAEGEGFEFYVQHARWDRPVPNNYESTVTAYDRLAGFKRNSFMIHIADEVYAISYNNSSGTNDSIRKAQKKGNLRGVVILENDV